MRRAWIALPASPSAIRKLNLSKAEYEAGVQVNDPLRSTCRIVDRYSKRDDDNDFIDLDAAIRNISNMVAEKAGLRRSTGLQMQGGQE